MPFDFEHNPRRTPSRRAPLSRSAGGRLAPIPIIGAGADGVASIDREYERRRKRAVRGAIVVALFVVAAAVAMVPGVLSTDWARGRIVSAINAKADGFAVEIDSWRFHWASHQRIEGVRVQSTRAPEWKASIPSITLATSLWRLFPFGYLDAGEVLVTNPRFDFHQPAQAAPATPQPSGSSEVVAPPIDAPGVPTTQKAPPPEPAESGSTGSGGGFFLPIYDLSAKVKVVDGEFHFLPAESPDELVASGISMDVSMPSISSPSEAVVTFSTPASDPAKRGSARCAIAIANPKAWIFDGSRAGEFKAGLESIDLAALSPALPQKNGAPLFSSGTLGATLEGSFDLPSKFDAGVACSANDIRVASDGKAPVASLQFSGSVSSDGETITVSDGMLTSPWASASIDGTTSLSDGSIIAGNLRAEADANLARIIGDFGPLLGIREGYGVRQGLMHSTLTLEGGQDMLLLKGKSAFAGPLSVVADGTAYELKSPTLDISLRKRGESNFAIDTFRLVTSFGQLGGAGDATGSRFIGDFDIAAFRRDYGQFFHDMPEMSGTLGIDLALDSSQASHTDARLLLTSKSFKIKPSKDSEFKAANATLRASAVLPRLAAAPKYVANADLALIDAAYSSKKLDAPIQDRDIRISTGCEWTPDEGSLKFGKVSIKGAWAEISGGEAALDDIRGACRLTASGKLAFDWGRLSRWLEQTGIDKVSIEGREARPFRVAGFFGDGADAFLARADAEIKTHVKSLSTYGLVASPADATVTLKDGIARIAYTPVVNKGKANVACEVTLLEATRHVRSGSRLFLLENVRLNDTVLRELLGYVNPLLTQCSVKGGTISASLMPFDLPLDKEQFQKSSFSARISLDNLELAPMEDFEEVLRLAKLSGQTLSLKHQALDIACRNGVIESGEQLFSIGKYPIVFRGRATLAGDADYRIDMPVGLAAADAVGPEFANYFKDRMLTIPVGGTVKHPRLDERSLRAGIKQLAEEVVHDEIRDNGRELLEKVWKNLQDKGSKKSK